MSPRVRTAFIIMGLLSAAGLGYLALRPAPTYTRRGRR